MYELSRALGSASCDNTHETRGYDLLRALGSASRDIAHETGVRLVRGFGFCVL